jgi:hypothetical protein
MRDGRGGQRSGCATLIFDDDGAKNRFHFIRPRAADGVERTARRRVGSAASDRIAPARSAAWPARRQRPMPDAGIVDVEVSLCALNHSVMKV